ncbi:hypothetical protein P280DRAFT_1685 [Massarina eburnea CBS 473.64]|uniref:Uncharacterized protein n=1 Tax=Massarina eburnea CBS 473.64 TaxID=1395130 RepID=A0A6A6SFQ2_9PLEO|nr:hypothetical protein P280DRAFT_1685 [Massarina eburnea CBS 473.64]
MGFMQGRSRPASADGQAGKPQAHDGLSTSGFRASRRDERPTSLQPPAASPPASSARPAQPTRPAADDVAALLFPPSPPLTRTAVSAGALRIALPSPLRPLFVTALLCCSSRNLADLHPPGHEAKSCT